ncbi:hypothetical protein [Nonomuraea sp. NPDC049141]|uniref:hypothetical protein n=1 Tax=Nonomuraea sp. NPDC049141 TaxID=3155500 RepID=UPI0033FE0DFA
MATHRQTTLFDIARDLTRLRRFPDPPLPELSLALEALAFEHADAYGWAVNTISAVRRGLRLLLALQDTPGAPIKASDVHLLRQIGLPVGPTLELLRNAQALEDDHRPAIVLWFEDRVQGLPTAMRQELSVWFTIMRQGSTQPPRFVPRADRTTRNNLTYALPVLHEWARAHESLREITRDDVQRALAQNPARRIDVLQGLRAIFRVLKARKLVFADPTARIFSGSPPRTIPTPQRPADLREALNSTNLTRAATASLLIFHGLRPQQIRQIRLTDLRDGRLHLDQRVIPLAPQVSTRLTAYLNYRGERWPNSANPHVFINVSTAPETAEAHYKWVNKTLGITAQQLREDRILDEAHASAGDVRRICDLFGLTVGGALRYIDAFEHPDLSGPGAGA